MPTGDDLRDKLDRAQRALRGKLTLEEKLEDEALDLITRLRSGQELTERQQQALLNMLVELLKEL